jgi:pilus assembly protein CpaF
MGSLQGRKFSAVAYSNELRMKKGSPQAQQKTLRFQQNEAGQQHRSASDIELVADEIRSYLVASRGRTEDEQRRYHDTLNRAILGFEEDRAKILAMIQDQLSKKRMQDDPPPNSQFKSLAEAVFAEVIGLNVLELILSNREGLEEVQVVGTYIFEVRKGLVSPSPFQFPSIKEVERIQQNLVLFNNDSLNPRKRWAEVMLQDGSRVTLTGFGFTAEPTLTIRFYIMKNYALPMLCRPQYETIEPRMLITITSIINSYFNMVVIGPTNSGKTNLIKAFIGQMPDRERIITIESRLELMLKRDFPAKNIIEYEIDEEDAQHSAGQAFKLALRQSPKRICHAEIRDEDANIYVRACTRGHEGSITSVHVNELEDVPDAITDMCMLDGRGMNPTRLRKRITEYVTQIGFEMAVVGGKRKVVRIGEFSYEGEEVVVRDIVRYNFATLKWEYPQPFSARAGKRIMKHDRPSYEALLAMGMMQA